MHGISKPLNWSKWYILLHFSPLSRAKLRPMSYSPKFYIAPQIAFSCICLNLFASLNAIVQQLHFYFMRCLLHQRSQAQIVYSSVKSDSSLVMYHFTIHVSEATCCDKLTQRCHIMIRELTNSLCALPETVLLCDRAQLLEYASVFTAFLLINCKKIYK